jgi:excisionase family DNA binding protein
MSDRLEAAIRELADALREDVAAELQSRRDAPDRLLSVDEAGAMLGLGRSRLYLEISTGRLKSVAVGRRRLVPAQAIADYIASKVA